MRFKIDYNMRTSAIGWAAAPVALADICCLVLVLLDTPTGETAVATEK
jgi:hypothetical protein